MPSITSTSIVGPEPARKPLTARAFPASLATRIHAGEAPRHIRAAVRALLELALAAARRAS